MSTTTVDPRVWLVAGAGSAPEPDDAPEVRDDQGRVWTPGAGGHYYHAGMSHTWDELRVRSDLEEVR